MIEMSANEDTISRIIHHCQLCTMPLDMHRPEDEACPILIGSEVTWSLSNRYQKSQFLQQFQQPK